MGAAFADWSYSGARVSRAYCEIDMIFSGVEQDPTNYYAASIKEKVDNVNNERTMSVAEERNLPMRSGRDGQTVDELNELQA